MTPLRRAVDEYLTLRRQLGVTLHETGRVLTAFAAYAARERADHVTTALVLRWTSSLANVTAATMNGRVQMIRRFAQWRQLTDARTDVPPPDLLPGRYRRRPPRLYREEDIPRLLVAARNLPSAKGLRGRTYATLFGLLVVTGLRSSEVVALDDADLARDEATLLVRRTKFGKSRLVPLHASTMAALTAYQTIRDRGVRHRRTDALFVAEDGIRITQGSAEYTFARVSAQIGLRPPFHAHRLGRGFPRLHDLRHRFAIRTLVDGYRAGGPVDPLLPVLATYLGHVHVHDTYWYLEAVPELLQLAPATLALDDLDAAFVSAFLDHVEQHRRNTPRTRNVRLAAIHAFCRYVAISEPAHLDRCRRILAIPVKRHERRPIAYLIEPEIEAVIAAPNVATWIGRRDRALLLLAIQTGLRVSELTHLRCGDIVLGTGAHLRCEGKGRKERCTPLQREMISLMTAWLRERHGQAGDPLFPTARGARLSRDAVERLVARHARTAHARCPSLKRKHVSPHVLRHTTAMQLLDHGVDRAVIALWLGHESVETTQMYLHADMRLKEQALARTTPTDVKPGRYRPPDHLLAFLERL